MKEISNWIGVMCISCYVMGLLMNLVQFTYTEKVIKLIIALFIIITVFKPVNSKNISDFEYSFEKEYSSLNLDSYQQKNTKQMIIEKTQETLAQIAKRRLDEKNISYSDISVHIYEQDGYLEIEKIFVSGCQEKDYQSVNSLFSDLLSEKSEISFGG